LRRITADNYSKVVLGIETSCDDTGVAVLGFDGKVLSSLLSSQITPLSGEWFPNLLHANTRKLSFPL